MRENKRNKITLLLVAIVAIGIFALPSTMAMFGGQHNWYDLGPEGNQVPCVKCHADVYDEYGNSGAHGMLSDGPASNVTGDNPDKACGACHRTDLADYTYASGDGDSSTPGQEAHAASTIACMECHEFGHDTEIPPYPWAGGFTNFSGSTYNYNNSQAGYGSAAAHNDFIAGAIADPLMEDSNEACITCHTHVAIDINWTHAYKMKLDAVQDEFGEWTCEDFVTEGSYIIETYGNMSGGNTNATDPTVVISPTPPGYDLLNP